MLVKLIMKVLSNLLGNGSKIKYTEIGVQKDNEILNIKEYVDNGEIYSTSEVKTNKVWIGKPIYRKVINFGSLPNNDEKRVDLNISNIDNIIFISAVGHDTINNNYWNIPNISTSGTQYTIDITITPTQVRIRTGTDRSSWTAFVILEYTKTTD